MKSCKNCNKPKEAQEFYKQSRSKDGLMSMCKECYRGSKGYHLTSEYKLNSRLKHLYGITLDQYTEMLEGQGGVCAICKSAPDKERLLVDHCHETLVNRGLLCRNCNTGLGQFRDDPFILQAAISYLEYVC